MEKECICGHLEIAHRDKRRGCVDCPRHAICKKYRVQWEKPRRQDSDSEQKLEQIKAILARQETEGGFDEMDALGAIADVVYDRE